MQFEQYRGTIMGKWMRRLTVCAVALAAGMGAARATPITYTISGPEDVRVTIGASVTNLTNTLVTITGTADTSAWDTGGFGTGSVDLNNATIFVQGFGTRPVTSVLTFFAGGGGFGAGFAVLPNGNSFDIVATALSNYDGVSNLIGVVGANHLFSFFGAQVFTTVGRVQIRDTGAPYVLTFDAELPEPASLTIFGSALAGVFWTRRRGTRPTGSGTGARLQAARR